MKRAIGYILYVVSAVLDDIAFYVFMGQDEDMGIIIETHWCKHYY